MARVSLADIEKRFYDCFASWDKADRATALKVLSALHEHLPAKKATRESTVAADTPVDLYSGDEAPKGATE